MGDRTVHQVALPFHWSYGGPGVTGDAANDLITMSGDPNVAIQESKAFVCDVRAGRTSRGTRPLAGVHEPVNPVRTNEDHPAEERPQA
jgi:formate dehydrogenase major subunit